MNEVPVTPLLEAKNIKKYFKLKDGRELHAVDNVSFSVYPGKTLGLVGESGCGKSTVGNVIMRLLEPTAGELLFRGKDVFLLNKKDKKENFELRRNMQMIFQDPYSSLNPKKTVRQILSEPYMINRETFEGDIEQKVLELCEMVALPRNLLDHYPHELDGGMRQVVGIARALSLSPDFIVCDEPVSALDVSIQAQILNLLMDLQDELGITYMFITHNMSVVRHISHNICVMYLGQLVETSPTKELFSKPLHPYTKALLSAIPSTDIHHKKERIILKGELVSPIDPKPGCRFATRCPYACEACSQPQELREVLPGHYVSCCRVEELENL
mgnify:CR=1 FL=1